MRTVSLFREQLIPARAGKTSPNRGATRKIGAHRRMGGENHVGERSGRLCSGSSPRGRGKLPYPRRARAGPRLIPAWAGKTSGSGSGSAVAGAHPRMGGENFALGAGGLDASGSSPHRRGKRVECGDEPCGRGLIPAWTGKTSRASTWPTAGASHPRVDGENLMRWHVSGPATGLSPRGRGKRTNSHDHKTDWGLIPARAGKTRMPRRTHSRLTAHPRAGGENVRVRRSILSTQGSSPRGRGKLEGSCACFAGLRLIPARAGKTRPRRSSHRSCRAHPRAGGENHAARARSRRTSGSSPRGRGKRRLGL